MSEWHVEAELAGRYAAGAVTPVLAASIELHLVGCAPCRGLLEVEPARLDRIWDEIVEEVTAPRPVLLERLLRRIGVSEATARVVATTPTLRGSWLSGLVLVLGLALYVAHASPRGTFFFLALAPVLPLLGVAGAFGLDPAREVAGATPYSAMRLLVARTSFVVATTLLPALAAALFLPGDHEVSVAWLLPSLAMTTLSLAAAHWVPVTHAALGMTALWVAICTTHWIASGTVTASLAEARVLQAVSLVVLVVAGASVVRHRQDAVAEPRRLL
ncbi:MAG: hypothetical protein J7518_07950 [Nocardioidaceae bacterium]|nr:hypothetical protein [Nocardioidaceae bacterium]